MVSKHGRIVFLLIGILVLTSAKKQSKIDNLVDEFCKGYAALQIPELSYDYREYFNRLPSIDKLQEQEDFFNRMHIELHKNAYPELSDKDKIVWDHLFYEITLNQQRVKLEKNWVSSHLALPQGGLYALPDHKAWYTHFIQRFTSLELSPEQVMLYGEQEVKRVKKEISEIQRQAGFNNADSFYLFLQHDTFYYRNKEELIQAFHKKDSTIRKYLSKFVGKVNMPLVAAMEWPDADANTPPGMYLNKRDNPYGQDVFLFNFYGKKYNKRAIDWLYMHEAIPGHHLQSNIRSTLKTDKLQDWFIYPGNFEGWACYVEYHGRDLGMYQDIYSYLGKWEWDLVRSARLVIEAGIHYKGWTREQALAYWKKQIPLNDDIAEREVTRVTNWPGQALSYKTGANCITQLKEKIAAKQFDVKKFHRCFLSFGPRPLSVIAKHFETAYKHQK
jgi:uncharacterized protein (DUF885 family)